MSEDIKNSISDLGNAFEEFKRYFDKYENGKSTFINTLEPEINLKTASISNQHLQGKHTTTFAEMHILKNGIKIIDTPGIKGFGVANIKPGEIGKYFPEIFINQGKCKFKNCLHKITQIYQYNLYIFTVILHKFIYNYTYRYRLIKPTLQ